MIGPMFSGKTSFLLHRLERSARSGKTTILFTGDTRSQDALTHSGERIFQGIRVIRTRESTHVLEEGMRHQVVGIDEVQFFDEKIVGILSLLADCGKTVLAAGLDQDYRKDPFLHVLKLLAESERITRLTAVCQKCGSELAIRSVRKTESDERILEGASETYTSYCRECAAHIFRQRAVKNEVSANGGSALAGSRPESVAMNSR
jgi:thymidine kinase